MPSGGVTQVWERSIAVTAAASRVTRVSTSSRLVSAGPLYGPGNAPSITPSIDRDGRVVAFATVATNLLAGATGDAQIVRAAMTGSVPQLEWVSKSADRDQVANGPSYDPSITDGGEWIFFDSTAGNIGGSEGWHNADAEPAGRRQVYRWTVPQLATTADITHVALESRGGPDGYIFGRGPRPGTRTRAPAATT